MKKSDREKFLRKREQELAKEKIPAIEVVGDNVAKPAKKWKVERSSSSKGIKIIYEKDEKKRKKSD